MNAAALLLAAVLAAPAAAHAEHPAYLSEAAVLDKAGRQRMLSQRMVKSYLQIAEGVHAARAQGQLAEAIAVFDDQIADLKSCAPRARSSRPRTPSSPPRGRRAKRSAPSSPPWKRRGVICSRSCAASIPWPARRPARWTSPTRYSRAWSA